MMNTLAILSRSIIFIMLCTRKGVFGEQGLHGDL